jgi:tRNA dimethylallyltransferase
MFKKIIAVVGPTASGKSGVAWQIAKKHNGFLISADSRQIYKDLNIVTGKDQGEWKNGVYLVDGVEEYMVDFLNPQEPYSAAQFQKAVYDLLAKNPDRLPVLVGGTGLYVQAVLDNYQFPPALDQKSYEDLNLRYEKEGLEPLVAELKIAGIDLGEDFQNPRRVLRVLAYFYQTGEKWQDRELKGPAMFAETVRLGMSWPRAELYQRIDQRVDGMIRAGALAESQFLYDKYGEAWPAVNSLGYQELIAHLKGEISLDEAIATIKKRSRNYAKRQLTWFQKDKQVQWVNPIDFTF